MMGHFSRGVKGKDVFSPLLLVLHFATLVSQWEHSEFCFLRQQSPHKSLMNFNCSPGQVFKSKPFCWLLMLERCQHIRLSLLPVRILFQNLGSRRPKIKIAFWEGFYVYRHSVNLFIIYDSVKDWKLTANWVRSKFHWHFLALIKALCLIESIFCFLLSPTPKNGMHALS